jgi:hypothetical protein
VKALSHGLFAILLTLAAVSVCAEPDDRQDIDSQQKKIELQLILNLFLKAVDGGDLSLFNQVLSKDMIEPAQIAQVYDLDKDTISITIFCRLTETLKVPHYDEAFYVDGLTAYINPEGEIYQITAHVKPY